jgi:hypothetical protein
MEMACQDSEAIPTALVVVAAVELALVGLLRKTNPALDSEAV